MSGPAPLKCVNADIGCIMVPFVYVNVWEFNSKYHTYLNITYFSKYVNVHLTHQGEQALQKYLLNNRTVGSKVHNVSEVGLQINLMFWLFCRHLKTMKIFPERLGSITYLPS